MSYNIPLNEKRRSTFRQRIDRQSIGDSEMKHQYIKEGALDAFQENYLADTKIFKGIVLINEVKRASGNFLSRLPFMNNDAESYVAVRVRIPEIHAHIPEPCSKSGDIRENRAVFEMHPLFVGKMNSDNAPAPGDIVEVSFNKGPNGGIQSDGIYHGIFQPGGYTPNNSDTCASLVQAFENQDEVAALNLPTTPIAITPEHQEIANATGVPVRVVAAFAAVESGGSPSAIRFECNKFNDKAEEFSVEEVPCTIAPGVSFSRTGSETNLAAFLRAYGRNKQLAVESTSFGSYQVMGYTALEVTGLGAEEFWELFQSDPVGLSKRIVIGWFNDRPDAVRAAQQLDWRALTAKYNGTGQVSYYAPRLENAYNRAA
jgi:hypothetical protein